VIDPFSGKWVHSTKINTQHILRPIWDLWDAMLVGAGKETKRQDNVLQLCLGGANLASFFQTSLQGSSLLGFCGNQAVGDGPLI
jgi:hypothetical protein